MEIEKILQYQKKDFEIVKLERMLNDSENKKITNQMVDKVKQSQNTSLQLEKLAQDLNREFANLQKSYEENAKKFEIVSKKELYDEWFLKHSIFPDASFLNTEKMKISFKKILRNFIVRNKSKSYLFCGFILLFSSIILPYHLYYLIFGSLLIIMSILCRFEHVIFR